MQDLVLAAQNVVDPRAPGAAGADVACLSTPGAAHGDSALLGGSAALLPADRAAGAEVA